jgi:hypothetical protein
MGFILTVAAVRLAAGIIRAIAVWRIGVLAILGIATFGRLDKIVPTV